MKNQYDINQSYDHLKQSATQFSKLLQDNFPEMGKNILQSMEGQFQILGNVSSIYQKWLSEGVHPTKIMQAQTAWWTDYFKLCENLQGKSAGEKNTSFVPPLQEDRRFKAIDWAEKPVFHFLQQTYLLFSQHCLNFIKENPSTDPKVNKQVLFFTKQYLDALSPSNFLLTSPEVLRHTIESKGENIYSGMKNLVEDIVKGQGNWHVKITDMEAFEVGKNLATTKGKVIFQNRLMELIQYSPLTEEVYAMPLLIVPPWINKYYILDLHEKNSFVKWCVEQGLTVFMISWVNPDESYRETSFADYLQQGILEAIDAIQKVTDEKAINAVGFCIGGTLLSCALGFMQTKKDNRIASATFLTSLIDFSEPGDIEVFIDEKWIASLEKNMERKGYLDGRVLMTTFNMLRSNDLWWAYYINNYLCGRSPFPLDLLYWNCDSTNMPAKMHSEYLRNMYLENRLCHPGQFSIAGVKLDLTKVKVPAYFLSTEKDHIAPWETTFYGAKCLGGEITFVLGESGHIAGVINPPENKKYGYRVGQRGVLERTPQAWFDKSEPQKGSWWAHWINWLKPYSGDLIKAREPGVGALKSLREAPGLYVRKRLF